MKIIVKLLCISLLLLSVAVAHADSRAGVEARLAKQLGLKAEDVAPTPVPGLYRITIGPLVAYVSANGHYLIRGDIIDVHSGRNLTVERRDQARLASLRRLGPADMLVFSPPHPKRTITVFTDIDCEYCRTLEHDRPALNAMGIAVRYLFFPRDGIGSASWHKATDVWCAKNRKQAFEAAMNGKPLKSAACNTAALMAGYHLGQMLGLDGTPAIITERGRLIDGYLPPSQLVPLLNMGAVADREAVH